MKLSNSISLKNLTKNLKRFSEEFVNDFSDEFTNDLKTEFCNESKKELDNKSEIDLDKELEIDLDNKSNLKTYHLNLKTYHSNLKTYHSNLKTYHSNLKNSFSFFKKFLFFIAFINASTTAESLIKQKFTITKGYGFTEEQKSQLRNIDKSGLPQCCCYGRILEYFTLDKINISETDKEQFNTVYLKKYKKRNFPKSIIEDDDFETNDVKIYNPRNNHDPNHSEKKFQKAIFKKKPILQGDAPASFHIPFTSRTFDIEFCPKFDIKLHPFNRIPCDYQICFTCFNTLKIKNMIQKGELFSGNSIEPLETSNLLFLLLNSSGELCVTNCNDQLYLVLGINLVEDAPWNTWGIKLFQLVSLTFSSDDIAPLFLDLKNPLLEHPSELFFEYKTYSALRLIPTDVFSEDFNVEEDDISLEEYYRIIDDVKVEDTVEKSSIKPVKKDENVKNEEEPKNNLWDQLSASKRRLILNILAYLCMFFTALSLLGILRSLYLIKEGDY